MEPVLVPTLQPALPLAAPVVSKPFKKPVVLAMPWYKLTNPLTAFSVMGLTDRSRTGLLMNFGDAFIAHTRNRIADLFLDSGCEWMLTIDDDMVVPFGDANWFNAFTGFELPLKYAGQNALDRLLSHGKKLIGACYAGRHRHGKLMYAEACKDPREAEYARRGPHDVIKPTRWVATGCMLIHRDVFLDIEKKFPRLARRNGKDGQWFTSSEHDLWVAVDKAREILMKADQDPQAAHRAFLALEEGCALAKANSSLGMGEDVQFCVRAKEAGHQPFVDLGLFCGHVGSEVFGPTNTEPRTMRSQ